jgi:3-oxoadipate enol-lactonase
MPRLAEPLARIALIGFSAGFFLSHSVRAADAIVESGRARVNGTTLYYERNGAGEPVVLLQGANLPLGMWDAQFAALAREFTVIRYDVRGFGRSEPTRGQVYRAFEDLRALLDHLKIERAHLVGLSLGGRIAIDFALECPDRVRSLVLAGPGLSGWKWSSRGDWSGPLDEAVQAGDSKRAAELWLKSPYMMPAMENPALASRLRSLAVENAAVWLDENREQRIEPPAIDRLPAIRCPTLVLVGSRDTSDIQRIAERLAREIPGARREIFDGLGHVLNLEAPDRFTETVKRFWGTATTKASR